MKNITITDTQHKLYNQLFEALGKLQKDEDFIKKMEIAQQMVDEDITDKNEDDYMKLINLKEDIIDITNNYFP